MLAKLAEWSRHRRQFAYHGQMSKLVITAMAARQQESGRQPCDGHRPYVDSLVDLRVPDTDDGACRRALRDDEMVNLVMEFLGGGTGPVVACLEWTLAHLVAQPEAQEKLRREIDDEVVSPKRSQLIRGMPYLHAVVLESLRMHPPVPFAMRHVQADASRVLVGGTAEPAASDLFAQFVIGDIGRDSKMWKDPDEFRPERFMAGGEAEGVGPLPGRKEIRMMPFGT
jgi:cytochrome P450